MTTKKVMKGKKMRKMRKSSKNKQKKGGSMLATAAVPFGLLALQRFLSSKSKKNKSRGHKHRH